MDCGGPRVFSGSHRGVRERLAPKALKRRSPRSESFIDVASRRLAQLLDISHQAFRMSQNMQWPPSLSYCRPSFLIWPGACVASPVSPLLLHSVLCFMGSVTSRVAHPFLECAVQQALRSSVLALPVSWILVLHPVIEPDMQPLFPFQERSVFSS